MEHAFAPPSSMGVLVHCPASGMYGDQFPDTSDETAAAEGDKAHKLAETFIRVGGDHCVNTALDHQLGVTPEMRQAAAMYAEVCIKDVKGCNMHYGIEDRVSCGSIHPKVFGHVDFWAYNCGHLKITDFKYGFGLVEAFENWQGISYASGLVDMLRKRAIVVKKITFTVVQPRGFHQLGPIRPWSFPVHALDIFIPRLRAAVKNSLSNNPHMISGDHCRYCAGLHTCPSSAASFGAALNFAMDYAHPKHPSPQDVGLQLSLIKRAKDILKHRETTLFEIGRQMIKGGKRVPGWAARESFGNRTWIPEVDAVIAIGDSYGKDLRKLSTVTPPQAEAAGVPKNVVQKLTTRKSNGFKLKPVSNKNARAIFGQ